MFCSKCGAEISEETKFCAKCGAAVSDNSIVHSENSASVAITGKKAGEVAFWHLPVSGILFLLVAGASEESFLLSLLFAIPLAFIGFKARSSIPSSVVYDASKKSIVTNKNKKFGFQKKSIEVARIKKIRLRKVKLGFSAKQTFSNPGEYFVLALDAFEIKKNLYLWIEDENEFNAVKELVLDAVKTEKPEISVDEDMQLRSHKDFYAEEK